LQTLALLIGRQVNRELVNEWLGDIWISYLIRIGCLIIALSGYFLGQILLVLESTCFLGILIRPMTTSARRPDVPAPAEIDDNG
jgi:hypothetical protein